MVRTAKAFNGTERLPIFSPLNLKLEPKFEWLKFVIPSVESKHEDPEALPSSKPPLYIYQLKTPLPA